MFGWHSVAQLFYLFVFPSEMTWFLVTNRKASNFLFAKNKTCENVTNLHQKRTHLSDLLTCGAHGPSPFPENISSRQRTRCYGLPDLIPFASEYVAIIVSKVSAHANILSSDWNFGNIQLTDTCDFISTGSNGKYWSVGSDGSINADSNEAHPFQFELCGQSRFYVRASNGCYIKGEQNGIFNASGDLIKATKWEY